MAVMSLSRENEGENEDGAFEQEVLRKLSSAGETTQAFDSRLVWLETRTRIAMGMSTVDSIKRLFSNPEAMDMCMTFLESENVRLLFLFSEPSGEFAVSHNVPIGIKSRGVYFLKASMARVAPESIDDLVLTNDLQASPLEQLNDLSQGIFFPLITNTENQEGWPDVILKEITENFYRFLANTYISIGRSMGRTLLPLPPQETSKPTTGKEKNFATPKDKDSLHVLENAVVIWTRQIKNVLNQEPEGLLKGDLNPGPGAELEFWKIKAANLNSIHEQLIGESIRKIMGILEVTKSTYFPAFDRLCKEVAFARSEANDNLIYLEPADKYFSRLLTDDFVSLKKAFRPIMQVTLHIWKRSQFYNTPARLVVLIREFCNDIIRRACTFMGIVGIAQADPQEAVSKLKVIIGVCLDFKESYHDFKKRSTSEAPDNPWRFQSIALFARLDLFLERCHDVLDLMQTLTQFLALFKIEIGGTKGKTLTSSVQQIFVDFQQSILVFQLAEYDVMNVDSKQFEEDFYNFRLEVSELERRVASVIVQAFEDANTILGRFKLLDSFEGLLEREILLSELEKKHEDLLHEYLADLGRVQEIFLISKPAPDVNDNAPPHAGAVAWARGLLMRVEDPMKRLKLMGKRILESEGGLDCERAFAMVVKMIREFENDHIQQWARDVSNTSEAKLKLSLLRRGVSGESPVLHVNFDPALVCLLREVKYFLSLGVTVPEAALAIYRNEEVFRVQTGNLDLIVNLYNHALCTLLDVEKPLVQQKIQNIDKVLQKGLKHINWKSHTIGDFIMQCMTLVKDVHSIVAAIKRDVADTQQLLQGWSNAPLMHRKQVRTYLPEEIMEIQRALVTERYSDMRRDGLQIHSNLANSQKVLRTNRGSIHFQAYVDYINEVLITGLSKAALSSCNYLLRQIDPVYLADHDINPLLEIQLKLNPPDIVFSPSLRPDSSKNLCVEAMIGGWITNFCNAGGLVKRVDTPSGSGDGDYIADVQADLEVKYAISNIKHHMTENEQKCEEFRQSFLDYEYLWTTDIAVGFETFMRKEGRHGLPPLIMFEERINTYRELEDEIRELPGTQVIGWLKIDVRPLRNSLLTCVTKWRDMYQQYLLKYVAASTEELLNYIQVKVVLLSTRVADRSTLELVLGHLRDIRKREDSTDASFEPLHSILLILAKYSVPIPPEVSADLDTATEQWDILKRTALNVKEENQSLQAKEAVALKTRGKAFEASVADFCLTFEHTMPFNYSEAYNQAYAAIDAMHHGKSDTGCVVSLVQDAERLNELQDSFELEVIQYSDVMNCASKSRLLKSLWDVICLQAISFTEFRKTKWIMCNVESMISVVNSLDKAFQALDSTVRSWHAYTGAKEAIDQWSIALPLVRELQHTAMRSRHWKQLMRITGVSFTVDERLLIGDLLGLQLYRYRAEVYDIVDRAEKELVIEVQLKSLEDTWETQELQFIQKDEQIFLSAEADLLDKLDENIAQLQSLQGTNYVQQNALFLDQVTKWQEKLGLVESTLESMILLQTKLSNLQTPFWEAPSVQEQVPNLADSLTHVVNEWSDMMQEALNEPTAVAFSTQEGHIERVNLMLEEFERCEIALAEFMEQKRRSCPRLYFVSPVDMVDILSKGTMPMQLTRHFRSCFDGVAAFEFRVKDAGERTTSFALGMYSQQGEYVQFSSEFEFKGQVDAWFNGLVRHTHKAVEFAIVGALQGMNEELGIHFVMIWPAQAVTTAFAIKYTNDVTSCCNAMGEGHENSLKDYVEKQQSSLEMLTEALAGQLAWDLRRKISSLLTLSVHQRDLVLVMVDERVESTSAFQWQSQLRFTLTPVDGAGRASARICDFGMQYGCEYVGNNATLVITPLTNRCFVTMTQALKLCLGTAISGNSGVGKTETVRELGRVMGVMVYVFNCSDQMDHGSLQRVLRGLASTGAWGCFDGFNHITDSVLSVLSVQLRKIFDAVRAGHESVSLGADILDLSKDPVIGTFATMNTGSGQRFAIPESTRFLFRPCAMGNPDVCMVSEILLRCRGFTEANAIAKKLTTLFRFCESLLSHQAHYNWGLRAIKDILGAAGEIHRDTLSSHTDSGAGAEDILYRTLLGYCWGKLVSADKHMFTVLLHEFFPGASGHLQSGQVFDVDFQDAAKAALDLGLQASESFLSKMLQLRDALSVKHAVFLLGPPGCGKSECIRGLCKLSSVTKQRTTSASLDPKCLPRSELFGCIEANGEWKDGILSKTFRDMSRASAATRQYLILDGDIDAEWVESLNSVMDENKVLTLASNERIPLIPSVRIIFESVSLEHASPAAISRGSVTFISGSDVGWQCFVDAWVQKRDAQVEKQVISSMMNKYIPSALAFCSAQMHHVVALPDINLVQTVCYILDALLMVNDGGNSLSASVKSKVEEVSTRSLEGKVVYSCIWGIGGALSNEKNPRSLEQFDMFWRENFKDIIFPEGGTVFDYYWETSDKLGFENWASKVNSHTVMPSQNAQSLVFVATADTLSRSSLASQLMSQRKSIMFCGAAGTGKTSIVKDRLHALDPEVYIMREIHLNYRTDSRRLQMSMEVGLEQRTSRMFGPPGAHKLVYFLDDINMPEMDRYGSQQPIALLRQQIGCGLWYNRIKGILCDVQNVQYITCATLSSGSRTIDPRFQRLFCTFAVHEPSQEMLTNVFQSIIVAHFSTFDQAVQRLAAGPLVMATLNLHNSVKQSFAPTATNFYYNFTLQDLSSLTMGICRSARPYYNTPSAIIRLWLHESERVYSDRLALSSEREFFLKICNDITLKWFDEHCEVSNIMARPIIFTNFNTATTEVSDRPYCPVTDFVKLSKIIEDNLVEYNETRPVMQLVMFEQAVEHVCRITRVFDVPCGSMLLVGVGGNGKRSLSMLASYICGHEYHSIVMTSSYSHDIFTQFLKDIYVKAGLQDFNIVIGIADAQVQDDMILEAVNDFLCRGDIADMFTSIEKSEIRESVRDSVKQAGRMDTHENCWEFFLENVRSHVHLCLSFSPVGDVFRSAAKRFPCIISRTTMDYFPEWPYDALVAVATSCLAPSGLSGQTIDAVAHHMAFVQSTVNQASADYLMVERRYNYTTPKNFLDLIELYKSLLAEKWSEARKLSTHLKNGLEKLFGAAEQVIVLQARLETELSAVEEMTLSVNDVLDIISAESAIADKEREAASGDEAIFSQITAQATRFRTECDVELRAIEPILEEADAAIQLVEKKGIAELKSLSTAPAGVEDIMASVMVLLNKQIPKDLSFAAAKKMMTNPEAFLKLLNAFDKQKVTEAQIEWCETNYIGKDSFNPEKVRNKSIAAAQMCTWVLNICKYKGLLKSVEPKRQLLMEANKKLEVANEQLSGVRGRIEIIEDRLSKLTEEFQAASKRKGDAQAQADKTMLRASTANRLVESLSEERIRWTTSLATHEAMEVSLVGDALLASSFVSYIGSFNARLRSWLLDQNWVPDMVERSLSITKGLRPVDLLTDPAKVASWYDQGLSSDDILLQNAVIVDTSLRWPLLIDPQLQGVKWAVKHMQEKTSSLVVVQMHGTEYLTHIEQAMILGGCVLVQNMGEAIDTMLHPVLSRSIVRRGTSRVIRVGSRDVEFDPSFKLLLHTKLSNPHYAPEVSAQTTIVNFISTREGLTDQLLRLVVDFWRPSLSKERAELESTQNSCLIQLKKFEDNILINLSRADGDVLEDTELILALEQTKTSVTELETTRMKVAALKRDVLLAQSEFLPVAQRAALLFTLLDDMWRLSPTYRFSLSHLLFAFERGLSSSAAKKVMMDANDEDFHSRVPSHDQDDYHEAQPHQTIAGKIDGLMKITSLSCFLSAADGLAERHKLVLAAELCLLSMLETDHIEPALYDAFVTRSHSVASENPLRDWLPDEGWGSVLQLEEMEIPHKQAVPGPSAKPQNILTEKDIAVEVAHPFDGLASDMVEASTKFREWIALEKPEESPLPGRWCKVPDVQRLLITRILRPDRSAAAMALFVQDHLGKGFVESTRRSLEEIMVNAPFSTPILFIISPGANPGKETEELAYKMDESISIASLGQGQESVASNFLDQAARDGGWVFLHDVHLSPIWTADELCKRLDEVEGYHSRFRLFISSHPSPLIPVAILQASLLVSTEGSEGLSSNIQHALSTFPDEFYTSCSRSADLQHVVTSLCIFHATAITRRVYGTVGWNQLYSFSLEDLTYSAQIAKNSLNQNIHGVEVPWTEIRHMAGEIFYGGHISDEHDRGLVNVYLDALLNHSTSAGSEILPGLVAPKWGISTQDLLDHFQQDVSMDSPTYLMMHPNAGVPFRLMQDIELVDSMAELRSKSCRPSTGASLQERASIAVDDILERLPKPVVVNVERFEAEKKGVYAHVFMQEIERANALSTEIRTTLIGLGQRLKGEMQPSETTDEIMFSIAANRVPSSWEKVAFPSLLPLASWVANLSDRFEQLYNWSADFQLPKATWLSGLFEPQSFLTAIVQATALRNDWRLDTLQMQTEVTKLNHAEIGASARDGAYVYGFWLQGARWDERAACLEDQRPQELEYRMPVLLLKAAKVQSSEDRANDAFYCCPVYRTRMRGATYIMSSYLKIKSPPSKWILAGTAMTLEIP